MEHYAYILTTPCIRSVIGSVIDNIMRLIKDFFEFYISATGRSWDSYAIRKAPDLDIQKPAKHSRSISCKCSPSLGRPRFPLPMPSDWDDFENFRRSVKPISQFKRSAAIPNPPFRDLTGPRCSSQWFACSNLVIDHQIAWFDIVRHLSIVEHAFGKVCHVNLWSPAAFRLRSRASS
jgi:hypothetical protein